MDGSTFNTNQLRLEAEAAARVYFARWDEAMRAAGGDEDNIDFPRRSAHCFYEWLDNCDSVDFVNDMAPPDADRLIELLCRAFCVELDTWKGAYCGPLIETP